MRCPFCHNMELAEGKVEPQLSEEEFFAFLETRKGLLDGVCITGGEPTLSADLPEFMKRIQIMGFQVKLDTNGLRPDALEHILDQGLADYVAMDIKNSLDKYGETVGNPTLDTSAILSSIAIIQEKAPDYEFRTTVVAQFHTLEDMEHIGRMLRGAKRYFLQNFVMSEMVPCKRLSAVSEEELYRFAEVVSESVEEVGVRGI